ncbi:dihydrolipoamide acetyltransferase family protein [Hirschia baltica]|uniref:Dihydrolipoamide acetyltransferase component of pyruvate dehydrogenase complex n=1 Tax=Hirschia baltica (strain ATCC 49814 / DSM 5838 / IFAM 1418) TaxID=582402 RepID=C6XJK9_HIRBI|nr:dihydrolipoamide acetyltransferase family protein [Hirschia baltica]ACT59304.1 catalytic domain of components of various dehydrogenase complexes [Hirschia baltica ATCC 49814]
MKNIAIKLPDVGEGVTEVEIVEWHVKVGDEVREDDVLAAVLTDKATVEIPSLCSGKIVWLATDVGDVLAVGSELVHIETSDDVKIEEAKETVAKLQPDNASKEVDVSEQKLAPSTSHKPTSNLSAPRKEGEAPLASPAVRHRALQGGIDLRQVVGSGPAGRITHEDLNRVYANPVAQSNAGVGNAMVEQAGQTDIKITGLRKKISEKMALANARIPHITIVEEVDVTSIEDLRAKLNDDRGDKPKLTVLPFITAAIVKAIQKQPEMNAHYYDDEGFVRRYEGVHAGIATMTENGLVVPVLRHAEAKSVWDIASELVRLSASARDGTAKREELIGSTITITSLGPLGAIATTPIINHPEVAIVGVNKIVVRPHWDGAEFVPRKMMNISSSFDHRIIDGWDAAVFVQRIKTLLETPALIFMGN